MSTLENVIKATQTADLLLGDLVAANRTADPVVHLHILRLTKLAADLRSDLSALRAAMEPQR